MISEAFTVGTSPVKIIDADEGWRTVYVHVVGNATVYLGDSSVTTANGLATEKHTAPLTFVVPQMETLWAVVAADTESVRVLRPSA